MVEQKHFPESMIPLGDSAFSFACHAQVPCFTLCCRNVNMTLYPYDIIRLKSALNIDSEDFLRKYTVLKKGDNLYFPTVYLKLRDNESKDCPFLDQPGCRVYADRPTACRTYPLERAVDRSRERSVPEEFYFMTNHSYCLGHKELREFTVKSWLRNQRLFDHNMMNDLWSEMDTIFAGNPWRGEGVGGEKQQLAFLACYNIDGFRRFVDKHLVLDHFLHDKHTRKRLLREDGELLKFGFEWIKYLLNKPHSLIKK